METTTAGETGATTETKLSLEREPCSRCGGCGHYSRCQMYGTTCFKCGGKGESLTKRGAVAAEYLKTLRSKPARDLVQGDVIVVDAFFSSTRRAVVESVAPYDNSSTVSIIGGVVQPKRSDLLSICHDKGESRGVAPEDMVQLALSPEQRRETLRAAIAYQGTLGKNGKPIARKRAA